MRMVRSSVRALALVVAVVPPTSRQASGLTINLDADARALAALSVTRTSADRVDTDVPFVLRQRTKTSVSLSLTCVPGTFVIRSARLVSAPIVVEPKDCSHPQNAAVFAAGTLHGTLRTIGGAPPPVVAVDVRRCTGNGQRTQSIGRYYAAVGRDGGFESPVPADCLDVTVSASPYAPTVLPRFALTLGQRKPLGLVTLTRGATVAVRVVNHGGAPVDGASVAILDDREYEAEVASLVAGTPSVSGRTARSDTTGLARVTALSPGVAYVVAQKDGRVGFAGPLDLDADREMAVGVQLNRGATVTIAIEGQGQWLGPSAKLAIVATPRVTNRWVPSAFVRKQVEPIASEVDLPITGRWIFKLFVQDEGSQRLISSKTVDVQQGTGNLVQFDLTREEYHGHVIAAGASPTGTLLMEAIDESGIGVVSSAVKSGGFSVYLPGPGEYAVDFSASDGSILHARATVIAVAPDQPLKIELPSGRVAGVVVRPDGTPAPNAAVTLKSADLESMRSLQFPSLIRRSGPTGAFEFTTLTDGDFEVSAALDQEQSDHEVVTVRHSQTATPLRLVLEPTYSLTGWVLGDGDEPIPGAIGSAVAETAPGQVARVTDFSTDMQGFFRARLDRPTRGWVQIAIAATGRPVSVYRVRATEPGVKLRVPATGGACRIEFVRAPDMVNAVPSDAVLYALVTDEGGILPLTALVAMNAASIVPMATTTSVSISSLAAGRWRLVKFPSLRAGLLAFSGAGSWSSVSQFDVAPGTTSRVFAK